MSVCEYVCVFIVCECVLVYFLSPYNILIHTCNRVVYIVFIIFIFLVDITCRYIII